MKHDLLHTDRKTRLVAAGTAALLLAVRLASAEDALLADHRLEDLDAMATSYVMTSQAFSASGRRAALGYVARIKAKAAGFSNEEYLLALMRIAAQSGNAHDSLHIGAGWRPATRLPLHFIWFPDDLVIARAGPGLDELVGATVTRVEGMSPTRLLARLRQYSGGPDDFLRTHMLWLVENGGMLYAMGAAGSPDGLSLELALRDGRRTRRTIKFVPRADVPWGLAPTRLWSSERSPEETQMGWQSPVRDGSEPSYLQEPNDFFRVERLPEADTLYVQFRANSTADAMGQDIGQFVKQVQGEIEQRPPANLILDLRFDVGGDIDQTRQLIRELAARTRQRIYVMTGPYTFSAGIVAAAAMLHDGGARVTIVGEPVGDRLRFWSEGADACLPHSQYCVRATNGLWDLTRGCAGTSGCYGDAYDVQVPGLTPTIVAPLTARAWREGRDPGMEAVRAHLGRPAPLVR